MRACGVCGEWGVDGLSECPGCGEAFVETSRRDPRLGKVRMGISLLFWGILVMLAAVGLTCYAIYLAFQLDDGLVGTLKIAGGLYMLSSVMMFIGKVFCLAVPDRVRASEIIYTAVAIDVLNVAIQLAQITGALTALPKNVVLALSLAGVIAAVLFLIFLKRLSSYVGREDLAKSAASVLNLSIGAVVLVIAGAAGGVFGLPFVTLLAMVVALMFTLIAFLRYVGLLGKLRGAL